MRGGRGNDFMYLSSLGPPRNPRALRGGAVWLTRSIAPRAKPLGALPRKALITFHELHLRDGITRNTAEGAEDARGTR
jgi:hypothetical protein